MHQPSDLYRFYREMSGHAFKKLYLLDVIAIKVNKGMFDSDWLYISQGL